MSQLDLLWISEAEPQQLLKSIAWVAHIRPMRKGGGHHVTTWRAQKLLAASEGHSCNSHMMTES